MHLNQNLYKYLHDTISVAREGAVCAPAPPRADKNLRRNLQGKSVSAPPAHQVHPQAE